MIPNNVLSELITVGRARQPATPASLADPEVAWRVLMCGNEPWQRVLRRYSKDDTVALIRGLVLFSQASGWSGGSVSPVSYLYTKYREGGGDSDSALANWILKNRRNDYEPFGRTIPLSVVSTEQMEHLAASAQRRRELRAGAMAEAQRLKRQKDVAQATQRLPKAVRRGDIKAVIALLAKGADWRVAVATNGSLQRLALEQGRTEVAAFLSGKGIE